MSQQMDLNTVANGQLAQMFQQSFEKVLENMADPNYNAKEKREIQIKLTFAQNEQRSQFSIDISVKEKLAAKSPAKTLVYMAKNLSTGQIVYEEAGNGLRGQMSLNDFAVEADAETVEQNTNIVKYQKEA